MGGPLTIPKVVNGKDRFFWFFGYQGQRQNSTTVDPQVGTFTPAELTGNFSQAANNASVAQFLLAHPYYQPNPQLASQGIIDPTKIDPVAKAFIASEPIPTSPNGILTPNGTAQDNVDEFVGKTDFNLTASQRLSVTLVRHHEPQLNPFPTANAPGYPALNTADEYFGGISVYLDYLANPAERSSLHDSAAIEQFSGISPYPATDGYFARGEDHPRCQRRSAHAFIFSGGLDAGSRLQQSLDVTPTPLIPGRTM